jgi:hypothetical protein
MSKRPKNLLLDDEALSRAESYCREHGTTLSRLVNDFFLALPDMDERDPFKSPIVERLMYASAYGPFEGDTYRDYLYGRREHITKRFEDDAYLED